MACGQRFHVLGPLEVHDDAGAVVTITRRKPRLLLALLLFRANSVVAPATLVDYLWGARPPASAVPNLQSYVTELRRVLTTPVLAGADRLRTEAGGYLLRVDDGESDMDRFTALAEQGAGALAAGAPAAAIEHLSAALALWRGAVLSGLEVPELLRPDIERLEEAHTRATEARAQAWLDLGLHAVATAELRTLTTRHPLRERSWELLMLALHRSGQTDEALAAYQRARQVLGDELSVEPGPELRRMQRAILTADPALEAPSEFGRAVPVRPRQLPPDAATVVGRAHELSTLDDLMGAGDGQATRPKVALLAGPAGVGKTTLAVRWAHRAAPHYPDGQLFADLQGYSSGPALPAIEVLTRFLHALGVRPGQVPTEPAEAAALYRSVLADRRVLVVLDNVATPEQVRALLPGSPGSALLITSRDRLAGLTSTLDLRVLQLAELSTDDSVALLTAVLGADRVAAEAEAAIQLATLCTGLPLALRIVAANLLLWPDQPLAGYLAELTSGDLLAQLHVPGDDRLGLRRTLDLSYDAVSNAAARFFCLLGSAPGAEVSVPGAAALAGVDVPRAARLLRELSASHLVQPRGPERFGMHDLLRAYAAARAEELREEVRRDALARLFAHYLRTADRAAKALYPDFRRLPADQRADAVDEPFEPGEARRWLLAEHANLLAAIRWTTEHGDAAWAWRFADVLRGFFHSHRLDAEWETAATAGLTAAQRAGDRHALAAMRHSLGALAWSRGNYLHALTELEAARESYLAVGALDGADSVLQAFGVVHLDLGKLERAIEHFTAALAAAEERGTEVQVANSLINLGAALLEHGRLAEGIRYNERAFRICRRSGSRHAAAIAQCNLGYGYRVTGELGRALAVLTESLDSLRELGSRDDEADALVRLAAVHRVTGDAAAARSCAVQAIAVAREAANRRFETDALRELGNLHYFSGEVESAHGCYLETLRLARKIGYRRGEIIAAIGLSAVDVPAAHHHASIAVRVAERGGFRLLAELARIRLAEASLDVGDHDEAVAHVMTALAKLRKAEHRIGEAEAWAALGRIRLRLGQPDAARRCTRKVETLLRETGAEPAMTRARMLSAEAAPPSPPGYRAPDPRRPSN